MLCVAIILVVKFFVSTATPIRSIEDLNFDLFVRVALISQIACVFAPSAIMTIMLARKPLRTLLLDRRPKGVHLFAAAALAVLIHPIAVRAGEQIQKIYPVSSKMRETAEAIQSLAKSPDQWWMLLALLAVLAPICEEFAFRGFVLSGARHLGHKWWAIALSAVAFGLVHMFVQQQIVAAAVGLVIGYLAVQTESLAPCIVYHAVHNGLQLVVPHWAENAAANPNSIWASLLREDGPLLYHPVTVATCGLGAAAILWGLHRVDYRRTAEEQLEEARQRQDTSLVGA
jgi:sodium transport system permease protein